MFVSACSSRKDTHTHTCTHTHTHTHLLTHRRKPTLTLRAHARTEQVIAGTRRAAMKSGGIWGKADA